MSLPSAELPVRLFVAPVTPLQQNCTVVWCTKTLACAVIDPGGDIEAIWAEIQRRGLKLEKIWVTHGHADHAGGTQSLRELSGAPVEGPHRDDQFWIERIPEDAKRWGIYDAQSFVPDRWLEDGDVVTLGETQWQVVMCLFLTRRASLRRSVTLYSPDLSGVQTFRAVIMPI
jgi:hydroxyacylglutathione hydrolase